MRVFLFSLAGIPLLIVDGILLYTFAVPAGRLATAEEGWIVLGGALVYLLVHFFLRKPERLYLWGHEFSHLVLAKIFFRITSYNVCYTKLLRTLKRPVS